MNIEGYKEKHLIRAAVVKSEKIINFYVNRNFKSDNSLGNETCRKGKSVITFPLSLFKTYKISYLIIDIRLYTIY